MSSKRSALGLAVAATALLVVKYAALEAREDDKRSWTVPLCTEDAEAGNKRAEPFTIRFNEKQRKAQLGNEFDAEINEAIIDFFIPYSTTDKDTGMYYNVNRVAGRYNSSFYSKSTRLSKSGTCVVSPKKKF